MRPRRLILLPSFKEAVAEYSPQLQAKARDALKHFRNRTAENALQPEQKKGRLGGIWTIRVTQGYRAFYTRERDEEGEVNVFFHLGPHDDYRTIHRKRP